MRKCNCCGLAICSDETYFDLIVWEMEDGEGCEDSEITLCRTCKERLIGD